jgi:anaerobic selenocysteine-containing dehydrogenase
MPGEGNITAKVRGNKNHPGSQGYLCNKAGRLSHYQNGKDRIYEPMRRKADGGFETISWDTAISEISTKLLQVKEQYGGDKILYLGGGQGNHISGPYAASFRSALGSIYKSNPIAQEKTGEIWVANQMFNATKGVQRGDCENAEVAIYLGKNPWHTHGFHQCRKKLQKQSKQDDKKIVVVDPRRSETADIADMHLAVNNGTDAWMMAALVAIVIQEDWVDHEWMKKHTIGFEEVYPFFFNIPVSEYCKQCGIEEEQLRKLASWIHEAESVAVWEDLGVQMNIHSTLVSYLQRLLLTITGNFGKKGTQFIALPLLDITGGNSADDRRTPVTNSRIIGGLIPCNVVSEEILTDHPDRMRALWLNGTNAVHFYAGSRDMAKALRATEITVVIDVAMTETAMEADYILPAPTQFEKAEMSMFQFEFPHNVVHLRHPVFEAPTTVLEEAEIYARMCEALGAIPQDVIETLDNALTKGEQAFGEAFFRVISENPSLTKLVPVILYRTLGKAMPDRLTVAAAYMPFCLDLAMKHPDAVRGAGHEGEGIELGMNLFKALVNSPDGLMITHEEWDASFSRLGHPDKKIHLHLPEMIPELASLADGFQPLTSEEYPFVLSCGERRDYTANGVYRDPAWRKKDYDCALRVSPIDAETLGVSDGQRVRITTQQGVAETVVEVNDRMKQGHMSLPNGGGLKNNLNTSLKIEKVGASTNDLTPVNHRDFFAGTPWHKYVPAKVERISA